MVSDKNANKSTVWLRLDRKVWGGLALILGLTGCAGHPPLRGTGDLGVVVERSSGQLSLIETSKRSLLSRVGGLGDLSHASVVFSRDGRYAYVFGRDGGLSKVDLLTQKLVNRVLQAGNSIGGAISQDGSLIVAANYDPGGIKVFAAEDLALVADIPAHYTVQGTEGKTLQKSSRVVGIADLPGRRFVYSLFDADQIWLVDLSEPTSPRIEKFSGIGAQPYDALVTPDGRYYLAGLFGEDGVALLDLWRPEVGVRKILNGYGRGQEKLPVYKMPHLRGWSMAGGKAYLPAVGRHEVLVVDGSTWQEVARIPVKGQPVFAMARPDGRQVWVNYAFPDNGWVEVIDTLSGQVVQRFEPGKAILHMEFTPKGEHVWLSARDDHKVLIYDTATFKKLGELVADSPSGIFFTNRANRIGF